MYLKNLTLSGFKSFGKTTVFEFPTPITGVVGPNGAGKSNVVEAIRWVLGEQSMKSLRGKKGEDLIFSGSEKASRLGRAEVKLVFDNSKKQFPFEFEDVIISRRVLRDGTNEYILNGSAVRLKDIYELLSRVGLGATQHHVISQGEVDRILWASPLERQEMVEEALRLREVHMKARETERKLAEVDVNMKQVDAQRRELTPHVKYLRSQAEKMKAHEHYAEELCEQSLKYAEREGASLGVLANNFNSKKTPLVSTKEEKEEAIRALQDEIKKEEGEFARVPGRTQFKRTLDELEEKRRSLDRELGKIEGLLLSGTKETGEAVSLPSVVGELDELYRFVSGLADKDSFESLRSGLHDIKIRLESLLKLCSGKGDASPDETLIQKKTALVAELRKLEQELAGLKSKKEDDEAVREDIMVDLRERERRIRDEERELEEIRKQLREIEFEEERYTIRKEELDRFIADNAVLLGDGEAEPFRSDAERTQLMRGVERLRIKLEEAGGIDRTVIQEFEEATRREGFLSRELEDLSRAKKSLEELMGELAEKLKEKFTRGLEKINKEFLSIFKTIFGGGRAELVYIKPSKKIIDEEEVEEKGGLEISLDIPRKRLRSLDMLSGGERALTSVALLFAMSTANPPPFLVLDETDAALDEANSQRYGDMLAELSKKTQLVVITHNRETMRRCGVLYGVTQGEDAISRVLSIKFEEASELAGVEQ